MRKKSNSDEFLRKISVLSIFIESDEEMQIIIAKNLAIFYMDVLI